MLAAYLQHPDRKVAQILYSGLLLLMTLTNNWMWSYASRDRRLLGHILRVIAMACGFHRQPEPDQLRQSAHKLDTDLVVRRRPAGTPTSYEQIRFEPEEKRGKLKQLAGPQGGNGVARINQDAQVFVAELAKGDEVAYKLGTQRHAWLHAIRGTVTVNGETLHTGDAAAISKEDAVKVTGAGPEPSEILLFDLA